MAVTEHGHDDNRDPLASPQTVMRGRKTRAPTTCLWRQNPWMAVTKHGHDGLEVGGESSVGTGTLTADGVRGGVHEMTIRGAVAERTATLVSIVLISFSAIAR